MEIVAFVERILGVSDHEQISLWLRNLRPFNDSGNIEENNFLIRISRLVIQKSPEGTGTVAQVLAEKLKCHLDWAIETDNASEIDATMQSMIVLLECGELRLAIRSSPGLTETFFRLLFYSPKWSCQLINLVNQEISNSHVLVCFLIKHLMQQELSIGLAKSLTEACSSWSLFLNCLVDHPCAPQLVSKLVSSLAECKDAINVLRLSTLLLWLTKDRQLLDNETASRILKLATTTFEGSAKMEEIEVCCAFFTVSCVKTTISARLRRALMAGLLRQLFEKNSRTVIPCVVDLLILIFDRALLTSDFIQQHTIPMDKILRWLNGHLMESVRAAKLLAALAKVGFFKDSETKLCIGEELKNVLSLVDKERVELMGGFIEATKLCLPSLYISVAEKLNIPLNFGHGELGENKSAFIARLSLVTVSGSNTHFCNILLERGLIFSTDNISVVQKQVMQSIKAVQEKLEFYVLYQTPQVMHVKEEALVDVSEFTDRISQLESQISARDNELLSLQFRYSTESSKVLEYQELSQKWLSAKSIVLDELRGLHKAVVSDVPDTRTISSYFGMLVGEVEVLRQQAESSTLKSKEFSKRVANLEERLMFTCEESRMYRETCEVQAQKLREVQEKENQLASHISVLNGQVAGMEAKYLAQVDKINALDEQLISTEARLHEAVNQYHGTREALAKAQLAEGQLRLELQSSQSLLEMRDQQIESLRSQIQDLNTRLLSR